MSPRIQETTVYAFAELDDAGKARAREWFRGGQLDYEWWDTTFDDAVTCLALLGFETTGKHIFFSGFWSQGDGACFEGTWDASKVQPVAALRQHAPKDADLRAMSAMLNRVKRADKSAFARIRRTGVHSHEHSVTFDTDARTDALRETIEDTARDAMRWVYRQLEREHTWLTSDEQVDGSIRANEYEFTLDGRRA